MALEYVLCNLCGSLHYDKMHEGNLVTTQASSQAYYACTSRFFGRSGPIVRCIRCGLVYRNPRPDTEEILKSYTSVEDREYEVERPARIKTFTKELQRLQRLTPYREPLLDVGTHVGIFLEVAQNHGWHNVHGVEPSQWAASQGISRGLAIRPTTLKGAQFDNEYFNVVTLWDVIEHFTDPLQELREIHRVMRSEGILCISTMNVAALLAKILGRKWPWYMEMHLYYFSPQTLSSMLTAVGFRTIMVRSHRRAIRLSFLASRLAGWNPTIGTLITPIIDNPVLGNRIITLDFKDYFALFAKKE